MCLTLVVNKVACSKSCSELQVLYNHVCFITRTESLLHIAKSRATHYFTNCTVCTIIIVKDRFMYASDCHLSSLLLLFLFLLLLLVTRLTICILFTLPPLLPTPLSTSISRHPHSHLPRHQHHSPALLLTLLIPVQGQQNHIRRWGHPHHIGCWWSRTTTSVRTSPFLTIRNPLLRLQPCRYQLSTKIQSMCHSLISHSIFSSSFSRFLSVSRFCFSHVCFLTFLL